MITIRNTQRTIQVDTKKIEQQVQTVLDDLGYSDFDIGIWLTTNKTIRAYNKKYRKKDTATDILSFPFYPDLIAGEKIITQNPDDRNVGDLIISLEYVQKDCARWGQTFEQRMPILLVHGICHLLGYDHVLDEDYLVMQQKEKELLAMLLKTSCAS